MTTATIDNKVRQVVANVRNLPTPPIVFHQIQKVINDPQVSAGQIASILSEDPAMSVKVLKLTNSAFYGLSREIDSVKQAVVIVGMEAIRNLVLSASVMDMFKGKSANQEFQERFWRHSLAVAVAGRMLARKLKSRGIVDPDASFSAGLLHDVGKMIMSCFLPEEYKAIREERPKQRSLQAYELEERVLGYNHAQVGAILAEQWKLPQRLNEAITHHHHPQLGDSDSSIAYIIHVADYLAKLTFYDADDEDRIPGVVMVDGIQEYMGFNDADLEAYSSLLREEFLKAETFMKMAGLN
jgi:putative nucleotidyltransferase with HDIG domain